MSALNWVIIKHILNIIITFLSFFQNPLLAKKQRSKKIWGAFGSLPLSTHLVIIFFKTHWKYNNWWMQFSAKYFRTKNNQVTSGHGSKFESYKGLRRIKSHNCINNIVNALIHSYQVRLIMLKQTKLQFCRERLQHALEACPFSTNKDTHKQILPITDAICL